MISRMRLEFAAEGFLASMRRSFTMRHPDLPCPIKPSLADYRDADRAVLIAAVEAAIQRTDKATDHGFLAWSEDRLATSE